MGRDWTQEQIDDHLFQDDDDRCHLCGGSGELDECECSQWEDTCCCLHPTPRECPECIERERDLARAKKAMQEPFVTLDEMKAEASNKQ